MTNQQHVTLETIYKTIVQWDEGGGKRSRRELARKILSLYATSQPQQEPVAFLVTWQGLTDEEIAEAIGDTIDGVYLADFRKVEAKLREKNHAAPQRQPLTDEQVWNIYCKTSGIDFYLNFARAIEAAHKIGGAA